MCRKAEEMEIAQENLAIFKRIDNPFYSLICGNLDLNFIYCMYTEGCVCVHLCVCLCVLCELICVD